ncbi:MAG TPA: type IV toxin-antitoxin system AbiEi family antitoxin domain-containing protein [Actinomycetota bacterium]|nr:type IV toxin-antitoxin system AbiEi family antitoxin domain-containing protein [Actinomycetota bacterium]
MQTSVDQALLELAAAQHWVLGRDQALGLGLSRQSISRRLGSCFLAPLHPSVYRVAAGPESWHQRLLAACMWTSGVASHRAALRLLGIDGYSGNIVDVSSKTHRASSDRVCIHRISSLPSGDVMRVGSIPTTTPTRTLLDVGSVLSERGLEEALDSALRQRLTSVDRLRAGIERLGGRGSRGPSALCKLLDARGDVVPTDSALETRLSRLLRRHRLPQPQRQVEVRDQEGFIGRVDFAYPELKIAIEVQSRRWHSSWVSQGKDKERLNRLQILGWIIIQVTYEDLQHHSAVVARRIREALNAVKAELPQV